MEEEDSRKEVIEDMSEDLSEGERADGQVPSDGGKDIKLARSGSESEVEQNNREDRRLYMVLIR